MKCFWTTVLAISPEGEVTLMDDQFEKSTLTVDNVILGSVEPDDALYEELLAAGVTAVKIGPSLPSSAQVTSSRVRSLRAERIEPARRPKPISCRASLILRSSPSYQAMPPA